MHKAKLNGHRDKKSVVTVGFTTKVDHQTTSKISCLMIDLGRETDSNNGICLGVHFAMCIMKSSTTRSY